MKKIEKNEKWLGLILSWLYISIASFVILMVSLISREIPWWVELLFGLFVSTPICFIAGFCLLTIVDIHNKVYGAKEAEDKEKKSAPILEAKMCS